MAKFNIKTIKPKFVVTTVPETKIDVVVNKPIIQADIKKAYFKLKNTGGPVGPKGDKGDPGEAATITVGSTSTLPAGSSASVVNSGTQQAAVLDFGIPKGDKGDTGAPGAAATVAVGTTTTGNPGTNASVTNVGTSSAAVLNFTIPKGDKGDTGATGSPGTPGEAATVAVGTTTTGSPGTNASVTNSGTSSAAVFNFTIPRGDKGDQGVQGNPGNAATVAVGTVTTLPAGSSATVTNVGTSAAAVFDFGIPKGDRGDAGSGSGDMLASDYDPNGTVKTDGGIEAYVSSAISGKQDTLTAGDNITITGSTIAANGEAIWYGTCSTAAGTAAKVVATTAGNFKLDTGNIILVKFTNNNTYNGTATLNVDGTGAKSVATKGTSTSSRYYWQAGEVICFVYDGTNFVMERSALASTTYYGLTKLTTSATSTSTGTSLTPSSLNSAMQYIVGYPIYSSSSTYAVGDRVRYGYYVYECNTAITTAESWNAAHWTAKDPIWQVLDGKQDTLSAGSNISISGTTISATVPTKTSQLTNDGSDNTSTYVEADELATVATSGDYSDLSNKPTIPTATSDLVNDSGYVTAQDYVDTTPVTPYVGTNDLIDSSVTEAKLAFDVSVENGQRIGTFNGNPLYKAILSTTCASSASSVTLVATADCTNWVEVLDVRGVAHGSNTLLGSFPTNSDGDKPQVEVGISGNNLLIYEQHTASYYNSKELRVIIEFTRSA